MLAGYFLTTENRDGVNDLALVPVRVRQQAEDLGVEPDQRHGQPEGNSPRHLGRCTCANQLISGVKVLQEAQRSQADAQQRETDG